MTFSEGPSLDFVGGKLVYRFGPKAGQPYVRPVDVSQIEICADCGAPIVEGVHR